MGAETGIQWTDATWNPTRGCSRISPGCENCYAETMAARFSGPGRPFHGFAAQSPARWTRRVDLVPEMLSLPLRWKKPRKIFVNSMSDLFHEALSYEAIDEVFGVMAACRYLGRDAGPGHTFQLLTKRAKRMAAYLGEDRRDKWARIAALRGGRYDPDGLHDQVAFGPRALPNVWIGVSVEDQKRADERIPELLRVPAAVRFLSCEPLLSKVTPLLRCPRDHNRDGDCDRHPKGCPSIDWVIVGGESGAGARPMRLEWARSIVEQCRAAGVACFVKQLGAVPEYEDGCAPLKVATRNEVVADGVILSRRLKLLDRKGGEISEWPDDLRVREFPPAQHHAAGGK